jgi:hypothetical protein
MTNDEILMTKKSEFSQCLKIRTPERLYIDRELRRLPRRAKKRGEHLTQSPFGHLVIPLRTRISSFVIPLSVPLIYTELFTPVAAAIRILREDPFH